MRNELKVWARDLGSFWARKYAEVRNWWKYGDSVGPTADQLLNQYGSWEKVIEASMRTSRSINEWLGF